VAAGPRPRPVPTRIVLVDDHAIMRQGLRAVLEREPDLHVVGEAANPADAVAAVAAARPHVVLLDLKLTAGPQTDGLDVCRRLCALHPGIGVLVLTTFAEDRLVVESVQAGARGCARSGRCRAGRARSTPTARRRWCGRCRAGCPSARA
jgi:two-component system response regulator DevR